MSVEYPCVYFEKDGKCQKFSSDVDFSYCVMGPCLEQKLSNADKIRAMNDEALAAFQTPTRYALMVDGEFAFSLHRDTFLLCPWLQKGAEVSPERLETLRQEDELRSARERALDLLSAAEQTSGTLRQKLLRWYGEEAVEAAVLRMEELELINDLDYGRRYAADAVNLRGWPRRRIAMELQKKGVPAEVIEEALADITEETEIETACRLLEGPYRGKLRDRKERDKVKAALQRRGFSYEVIRQAVSRTLEALPEGGETPEPEETPETGDGQEELLALIRKKYAKNMADRAGMEKTIAALYRRGYPLEAIKAAMNTILEQEENCRDD